MEYNANSIETLSFHDAVRTRIAMYMGSADNMGVLQGVREIVTNSIDEFTMGYGKDIKIDLWENNRIAVADHGRGVPFGLRADGVDAIEAVYTMAHSGGKFDNKIYQNVAGLNGVGAKGAALSSDYFKAISNRNGTQCVLILEKGIKKSLFCAPTKEKDGTYVEYIPSQEVYNLEPIKIDFEEIKKMCRDWSYLCKGLKFDLTNHVTNEHVVYLSNNGLLDFIKDTGARSLHRTPMSINMEEDGIEAEIVMCWTEKRTEEFHVFTNGLENSEGGTSSTGIKTALTNFFKKKIKNSSPDLVRKGMLCAVSCKVPNPSFSDQTKRKVNNPELRGLCQRATTKMLEDFEMRHKDEFDKIIEVLTKEMKAEAAAERARVQVLNAQKDIEKNQKRKVFASDKLKDAEFLGQDATLCLVEGLSAASSIAVSRDEKKYGILALRGKMINAFANDEEKFYQNEEVKLLLSAMNIVPNKYDSKKLRYGKVAILVDADSDGFSIGLLIMCALYKVAPQFIEEGRLCWIRSPLYIVKNKDKEEYYFTDEEFNKVRNKVKGVVQRNKGLGSLSAEQAHNSMFIPENQHIDILIPNETTLPLLMSLMGKDSEPKHDFIFENLDFSEIRE